MKEAAPRDQQLQVLVAYARAYTAIEMRFLAQR